MDLKSDGAAKKNENTTALRYLFKALAIYFILSVCTGKPYVFAGAAAALPFYMPCIMYREKPQSIKLGKALVFGFFGIVLSLVFMLLTQAFSISFITLSALTGAAFLTSGILCKKCLTSKKAAKINLWMFFILNILVACSFGK